MSNATTAYVDSAGRPRLRESIVAFIDILGFSNIATSCQSMEDSQRLLDKIAAAIDDSRSFVRLPIPHGDSAQGHRWATKFFSDNLAFGYPFDESVDRATTAWFIIRSAQRYQLKMTLNGFFVRGALTSGPVCLTDEIIFGSALIDCYLLESKASIVPRIVLSEPLQQLVMDSYRASAAGRLDPSAEQAICRDVDGWWFVNYLDAAQDSRGIQWELIEQHKASILESLSHTTRHDVLPKYGWACRYHNVFCHWHRGDPGYSDAYRISRVDEQSTIYRLSDAH
jgi:hypothetical protein